MITPNKENIDRWLFDWKEGNLSPKQEYMLEDFLLLHPELELDADAWDQTQVSSIAHADFNPSTLYKKEKRIPVYYWFSGALALLIITFGLFDFTKQSINGKQSSKLITHINHSSNSSRANNTTQRINNSTLNKSNLLNSSSYATTVNRNNLVLDKGKLDMQINESLNNSIETVSSVPSEKIENDLFLQPLNIINYLKSNETFTTIASFETRENETENIKEDRKLNLPSLHLSKNSSLSKWLSKDISNTDRKERLYIVPEKSNIDLNSSFVGALSQFKLQSMSSIRYLNSTGQQKINQQISFDSYSRSSKAGFGLVSNYSHFGNGVIQDFNTSLIFSPKIAINRFITLSPSVKYTMGKKTLNNQKIINNSLVEYETNRVDTFSFDMNSAIGKHLWYRDLSSGLVINAGPVYIGAQVNNIFKHQDNIYTNDYSNINRAERTLSFIGGTDFVSKNQKFAASPYVYLEKGKTREIINYGLNIQLKSFTFGGSYQQNGAMSAMIGLHTNRLSLLGQSTYTSSSFNNQKNFIHQLTLRINSNISRKARRYLYL